MYKLTDEFKKKVDKLDAKKDNNFCAPLALSLVTGTEIEEVADYLHINGLREHGKGMYQRNIRQYLTDHGYDWDDVTEMVRPAGGRTLQSVTKVLNPEGTFLIWTARHITAYTGGQVQDWVHLRLKRVTQVHVVYQKGKSRVPALAPATDTPPLRNAPLESDVMVVANEQLKLQGARTWVIMAMLAKEPITKRELAIRWANTYRGYYKGDKIINEPFANGYIAGAIRRGWLDVV